MTESFRMNVLFFVLIFLMYINKSSTFRSEKDIFVFIRGNFFYYYDLSENYEWDHVNETCSSLGMNIIYDVNFFKQVFPKDQRPHPTRVWLMGSLHGSKSLRKDSKCIFNTGSNHQECDVQQAKAALGCIGVSFIGLLHTSL